MIEHPSCPRCGYDQSGEAAAWESSCPVNGTCPECGHGFAWADLFDPSRQDLAWSVESGETRWARLRKTPGTAVRMALPWVYWSRVGVGTPLRLKRLASWLVWFSVALQVAAWPFVFFGLGILGSGRWPVNLRSLGDVFSDLTFSEWCAIGVAAVGWPLVYVGPDWSGPWFWGFYSNDDAFVLIRFMIGVAAVWCIVMTALPVTRRTAKLRPGHVARAAVLQIGFLAIYCALVRVAYVGYLMTYSDPVEIAVLMLSFGVGVWSLVWWGSALRCGWSIRSPLLLVLGTLAAFLGGLVAVSIEDSVWYLLRY